MICRNCKKEILDKAKFCGYCGKEVKAEDVEIKKINNNKKVFKWKIVIPILAILVLITGRFLRYNEFYDKLKNSRDNLVKYIELFDGYAYYAGHEYGLNNGLIEIYSDGELIYKEYEINKGEWYFYENGDLLKLDVGYLFEDDITYSIIKSIVNGGLADNYYEDIGQYSISIEDGDIYYFNDDDWVEIYIGRYREAPGHYPYDLVYRYNLNTRDEEWLGNDEGKYHINREIAILMGQVIDVIYE